MWNLKKKNWYGQSYLQSRGRDTEVENKDMNTKGGGVAWIQRLGLTYIHDWYYV